MLVSGVDMVAAARQKKTLISPNSRYYVPGSQGIGKLNGWIGMVFFLLNLVFISGGRYVTKAMRSGGGSR